MYKQYLALKKILSKKCSKEQKRKSVSLFIFIEKQSNKGYVYRKLSERKKLGPGSCSCSTYVAFIACALNAHPYTSVCVTGQVSRSHGFKNISVGVNRTH